MTNPVDFIDDQHAHTERLERDLSLATTNNDLIQQIFNDQANQVVRLRRELDGANDLIDWMSDAITRLRAENARLRGELAKQPVAHQDGEPVETGQ